MDSEFGIDQGFDYYNDRFEGQGDVQYVNQRKADEISSVGIKWLDDHKDEKFFLFLHYFDPHANYEPPEPFTSRFRQSLYAGEIAYTDHCIGRVIDKLKNLGLYDSTLLIITSDHGESLGEHLERTHAYFVYQGTIKVPLIFKIPGGAKGKRISGVAGLIDIVPTVCVILGVKAPGRVHGQNLFGRAWHRPRKRQLYCESLTPLRMYGANPLRGIVTDRFKYIQTTRPELYNLVQDPKETNNLISRQPHQARILQEALDVMLEQNLRSGGPDSKLEMDDEMRKRLESLGYIDGVSTEENAQVIQGREDPKDLAAFHLSKVRLRELISFKQYTEAKSLAEEMLGQRPGYEGTYRALSNIAEKEGNEEMALSYLLKALEVRPGNLQALNALGALLVKYDRPGEAFKYIAESLRINPNQVTELNRFAWLLKEQGKVQEAITNYRKSLRIKRDQPKVHCVLAELLYAQSKVGQAIGHWKEAVKFQADFPEALNNLAWITATHPDEQSYDPPQAVRLAEKVCELTKFENPEFLDTLSAAYAAAGKFNKAIQMAEKALKLYQGSKFEKKVEEIQGRLELYKAGQPYCSSPSAQNNARP
jgi:tetratricopeptide (TPR) repeat protein